MLLQRIVSLTLVLLGDGLGLLLPRPWAEVPEAEAARPVRFLCVGFNEAGGGGHTFIYNVGQKPVEVRVEFRDASGDSFLSSESTVEPGHGIFPGGGNPNWATLYIEANGPIVADASVSLNDNFHFRHAPCIRIRR